ncbi:uncharacterized protein LOC131159602 [Malania oleifera]|uniref:uncharacterized protein LOC131159602 n=1 Tax=Malania oleifera TaxID=397392 RepID=UPI0025AE9A5F|nr:uncharacterized protein LOC131159602 [Malania oleifera]
MGNFLSFKLLHATFFRIFFFFFFTCRSITLATKLPCRTSCGSLEIKYPFGTAYGCGSPRFHPYVSCAPGVDQLLLSTHTGSYPITSISYATSTLTIAPPLMSTCTSMHPSPNLGLDWPSPFQLGPSTFLLLSCSPPSSSLTVVNDGYPSPVCDLTSDHLCASVYTCPSVVALGLPLFPPTNTCCVYSPANLDAKGELDLRALKCAGYASVVSLGDDPTEPTRWEYGVALTYNMQVGFDNDNVAAQCGDCEKSGGACGYVPHGDSFACVCENGFNSSTDCYGYSPDVIWSSDSRCIWKVWLGQYCVAILFSILTIIEWNK